MAASSRIRFFQFANKFREEGYEVKTSVLFNSEYLKKRYNSQRPWLTVVIAYCKQIKECLKTQNEKLDFIWIEREILPFIPLWFEVELVKNNVKIIVDIDDADYTRYKDHWWSKCIPFIALSSKIENRLEASNVVFAGNHIIAKYAKATGAKNVYVVPTVVDTDRYQPSVNNVMTNCVGWIGSPLNTKYLLMIIRSINELASSERLRFLCIGGDPAILSGSPVVVKPWSEASELDDLAKIDVGIMPLPNSPFERGKCGYKLLQYMASGKPVIASPVGVNKKIVNHGINGFLAQTTDDWINYIKIIYSNKGIYDGMCRAARETVETNYSIEVAWSIIDNTLKGTRMNALDNRK